MFRGKVQRIHFVGIGGSGMSGIAEVLLTQGYTVTGSDMKAGQAVRRLRGLHAEVQGRRADRHQDAEAPEPGGEPLPALRVAPERQNRRDWK